MVSEYNPLIEFIINTDPLIDLNNSDSIIVHVLIDSKVVLKFKKGGGAGYDGDISINPSASNKCSVVATLVQGEKIKCGQMLAEIQVITDFPGYDNKRKIKAAAVLQRITFATTIL
jgi:aerobic-type carbon monoxide dehydrogenase small subunit (CoxS/CutS family)